MSEKKREEDPIEQQNEDEPNFSDPEDFIDDITDEGKNLIFKIYLNFFISLNL